MSNSPLVNYTKISPNKTSPRNHAIDTITIHCVVGQCSVETLGEVFAPTSRQASSNYGIGYDGKVGMYVEEKDRSWCSSSASNDNRAITIEVASDTTHPYAVNAKAYAALLDLVTDICKRNGIKKLLWKGDKTLIGQVDKQNMTVHRWFANKACPGDYLYNLHGEIAAEVNKRLGAVDAGDAAEETPNTGTGTLYRVQIGAFKVKGNADGYLQKAKAAGFADAFIAEDTAAALYRVQIGAFGVKSNADACLKNAKAAGFDDAFIVTKAATPTATPSTQAIKVGSTVRVKQGAKTYTGGGLASFVYTRDHVVKEISGDRVVITFGGVVVAAVNIADLTLV